MNINQRTKAIALIVFGVIIAIFALIYPFGGRGEGEPAPILLPDELASFPRRAEMFGLEAIENITKLHGKDFALIDGAVGGYGQNGEMTLWVSQSTSEKDAADLVIAMRDKIAEGNSPYDAVGEENLGDRIVYALTGLGMTHFYFQSKDAVIWLAVDHDLADEALTELIVFYP